MFSEDSILHGGVNSLARTRQVRPFPGPSGLVASPVSAFHVQNVSFSSGVHTNSSALGMRLLFAMMLLCPAFRRLIEPQCKLFGPRQGNFTSLRCRVSNIFRVLCFQFLMRRPFGSPWSGFSRRIIHFSRLCQVASTRPICGHPWGSRNVTPPGETRILLSPVTPRGVSD